MKAGARILDAQHPAHGIIAAAVAPSDRDSARPGDIERIEHQVLRDAANLDGIAFDRQRAGPAVFKNRPRSDGQGFRVLRQFLEHGCGVERLTSRNSWPACRRARSITPSSMECREATLFCSSRRNSARIGSVRGYSVKPVVTFFTTPKLPRTSCVAWRNSSIRATLQVSHLLKCLLHVADMPLCFGLLQVKVLGSALADALTAHIGQRAPSHRHYGRLQIGMSESVALEFLYEAQMQVPPFTSDFSQVIALLPSLQAVAGRFLLALHAGRTTFIAGPCNQAVLESVEQLGNVVVELRTGQGGGGTQFGIPLHGLAPGLQNLLPARGQMRCESFQLVVGFRVSCEHVNCAGRGVRDLGGTERGHCSTRATTASCIDLGNARSDRAGRQSTTMRAINLMMSRHRRRLRIGGGAPYSR